jgi:hypothetical protein
MHVCCRYKNYEETGQENVAADKESMATHLFCVFVIRNDLNFKFEKSLLWRGPKFVLRINGD